MSSIKSDEDSSSKKDFCANSVNSLTSSDFSEDNYRQVFHDILVRGVSLDIKDEIIEEELKRRRDVKELFRVKNRTDDRPTTTFRIRLKTAEAKNHFLLNGIHIQGKVHKCEKFHHARIIRCFRCQQFGHAIEDCMSPTPICSKCTGTHQANECRATVPKCVNCRGEHASFDKACPAWLAYVEERNSWHHPMRPSSRGGPDDWSRPPPHPMHREYHPQRSKDWPPPRFAKDDNHAQQRRDWQPPMMQSKDDTHLSSPPLKPKNDWQPAVMNNSHDRRSPSSPKGWRPPNGTPREWHALFRHKETLTDIPEFRPRQDYRQQVTENGLWKPNPQQPGVRVREPPAPVIVNAQAITKQDLDEVVETLKEHINDELESVKNTLMNALNETLDQIRIEVFTISQNQMSYPDSGHGSSQPFSNSSQGSLPYSDVSTSTMGPQISSPGGQNPAVHQGCTFYSYRPNDMQPMNYMNQPPTLEVGPQPLPVAEYPQDMPYQTTYYPPNQSRCGGCYVQSAPNHVQDNRINLEEIRAELMKVNEAFFDKFRQVLK